MLLLAFSPTIALARVMGLGIGIGWIVVGRDHLWCLLWSVGVGIVELFKCMVAFLDSIVI